MVNHRTEEHKSWKILNLSLQFLSSLVDAWPCEAPGLSLA